MILSSGALIGLYVLNHPNSILVFRALSSVNLVAYLLVTLTGLSVDPEVARRCWREALAFPGLLGLAVIGWGISGVGAHSTFAVALLLFAYAWQSLSMVAAALVRMLESTPLRPLAAPLLYIVGYGPLLCAITATAYIRELRGAELVWEKTEKTGTVTRLT
jgi:hypothetical protein